MRSSSVTYFQVHYTYPQYHEAWQHYKESRKKIIQWALWGISDQNFYMGMQNEQNLETWLGQTFAFHFQIGEMAAFIPHMFQYRSHTFAMNMPMLYVR